MDRRGNEKRRIQTFNAPKPYDQFYVYTREQNIRILILTVTKGLSSRACVWNCKLSLRIMMIVMVMVMWVMRMVMALMTNNNGKNSNGNNYGDTTSS